MHHLEGSLITINEVLKSARVELSSMDQEVFITALVHLCYEMNVDVPIWTYIQDRELSRKGIVEIPLDDQRSLRVTISTT